MANGETGLEMNQVYYKGDMVNKVIKHGGGGGGGQSNKA